MFAPASVLAVQDMTELPERSTLNFQGPGAQIFIPRSIRLPCIVLFACLMSAGAVCGQVVTNGAGAYTTTLPAGATAPASTIYTTQKGPVPTHKYWTSKLWTPLNNNSSATNNTAGYNMIPQPLTTSVTAKGMLVGVHGDVDGYPGDNATATAFYQYNNFDLVIGNASLNATAVNISASSDWSADFNFGPSLTVRTGRGMPFAYALTDGTPVTVTFSRPPTVVTNNTNILLVSTTEGDTRYTNYYGLFCPTGGTWAQSGSVFTCSEAVNAWTGMILLGAATGDTALRDAGIWLYTQETKGAAYYWFNEQPAWVNANAASTYPSWFAPLRIANEYDDKGDEATFFGTNPDFEHAIEFLPFTGGSLHLGLSPNYVQKNYNEDVAANIAAKKPAGDWPDLMAEYEALSNPATALTQWQAVTAPTDGETLAHEYAWITSLQALGQVDSTVTANTPYYAVFNNAETISHVAFNPATSPATVTFSDGASLTLAAGTMASDSPLVTSFTFGAGVVTVQPPAAPTGVTATAKSATEIDLGWTIASGVTYDVYRSTTSGFTPSPGNMIASSLNVASYSDLGLTASTTYYYVVEAVNSGGNSPASSQVSAMTTAAGTGGAVSENNTLYLVGGATVTSPSLLSFTAGTSGADYIPANNPQSPGVVMNPLVYTITGVNGTYDSAMTTAFNLYVDAGTNVGEAAQVEVLYDLTGSGTFSRTELYSLFAANAAVDYEDYMQTSRGGLSSATGTLGNMTNGTIVIKVWSALPGANSAPIALSVGNNPSALSDLVIPFTSVTQTLSAPVTPTGLTAVAASSSAINLSWMPSTTVGVTYSLYRSTTSGFVPSAANMIVGGLSGTSYTDVNLTANTKYNYVVEAVNGLGNSAPSAPASATTMTPTGPISGSNVLYLVAGATQTTPSLLSFVGGPAGVDSIPINNPQSPDVPMNPLIYTITGISGTYDNTMTTAFNLFVDAGVNPGEGAQVEVLYDLTGSGTFSRTELYHFFATDPVVGYEDYAQIARGGLETATGSLGNMTNGTIVIKVWDALPGVNAVPLSLSVGSNPNALSDVAIPFNTVTQTSVGPTAPTNVMATAKSYNEVDLTWMASSMPSVTYNIYRSTASGFYSGDS